MNIMENRNSFIVVSAVIIMLGMGSVAFTWFILDSIDEDVHYEYTVGGVYLGESAEGTAVTRDLSDIEYDTILRFTYEITASSGRIGTIQSTLGIFGSSDRPDPLIYKHAGDVEVDGTVYDGWTSESDGFTFTYCFGEGSAVEAVLIDSEGTHLVARLTHSD